MSFQLFNPKAGKFVNANPSQAAVLKKAGWLVPGDKKIKGIVEKFEAEAKAAKLAAENKE